MPQILESAPPTPHGAYYTGFCAICHAPEVAHSVDGKLWCCKCWVDNGFPPADWHLGCVRELEQHKKVVETSASLETHHRQQLIRSARIVERAGFAQEKPCADCSEHKPWVVWDTQTGRGLCADCKAERVKFDESIGGQSKPLFPI